MNANWNTDPAYFRVVMSLFGKFFISCSLGLIYFYTAELFPTSTRSAAVGLCSTISKFGSFAGPVLAEMVSYNNFHQLKFDNLSWQT